MCLLPNKYRYTLRTLAVRYVYPACIVESNTYESALSRKCIRTQFVRIKSVGLLFTLRASCGAVYCYRSCLWVCLWVCYRDNWKLRASILTKLGLLNFGRPAPPGRGLRRGENFWLRLIIARAQCLRLSERFFHKSCSWTKFRVDDRKSLYFNHSIKADNKRNSKLKIINAIC